MLKKILGKIGYIPRIEVEGYRNLKEQPFTEEELSFMLSEMFDGEESSFSNKEEIRIFNEAKKIEGLVAYLKATAMKDMMRYFGAQTPQEQLIIRGSFARTNYIKSRIISADKPQKENKLEGIRYS